MKKHQFKLIKREKVSFTDYYMYTWECIHCKETTSLDAWQIMHMPKPCADCESEEAPTVKWYEHIFGIDCIMVIKKHAVH